MRIQDAYEIVSLAKPSESLRYNCTHCDRDYVSNIDCCGFPTSDMYAVGTNTPYQEYCLAEMVIEQYELEQRMDDLQDEIENLESGSRW